MANKKEEFIQQFEQKDKEGNYKFVKMDKRLKAYWYIPGFNYFHVQLYLCLLEYRNEEFGYAYPNYSQLITELNSSSATISKGLKKLEEVGLIKTGKNKFHGNNIYYVYPPLPMEQFAERFPEAVESLNKKFQAQEEKVEKDKERLRKKRQQMKARHEDEKVESQKPVEEHVEIPQVDEKTLKAMVAKAACEDGCRWTNDNPKLRKLFKLYPQAQDYLTEILWVMGDSERAELLDTPTPNI